MLCTTTNLPKNLDFVSVLLKMIYIFIFIVFLTIVFSLDLDHLFVTMFNFQKDFYFSRFVLFYFFFFYHLP